MAGRHEQMFGSVLKRLESGDLDQAAEARERNHFLQRSNTLARKASGAVLEKTLHWVEPERCRMWERHNRRYELLNEETCADLIEGFKAQGQQEFPAIVRKLENESNHDYEVICGARRHWTVSWLRQHKYTQFNFLIEIEGLTSERLHGRLRPYRRAGAAARQSRHSGRVERASRPARAATISRPP